WKHERQNLAPPAVRMPAYPHDAGRDRIDEMRILAFREHGAAGTAIVQHRRYLAELDLLLARQEVLDLGRRIARAIDQPRPDFRKPGGGWGFQEIRHPRFRVV